jgi:hypothetical protein
VKPAGHFNPGVDIGYTLGLKHTYNFDLILGMMCNAEGLRTTVANDSTTCTKLSVSHSQGIGYRFYLFKRKALLSPQIWYWYVNHYNYNIKEKGHAIMQ